MAATMGDWIGVALVLGVALAIFILKFIFIKCYFNRTRRRNDLAWLSASDIQQRRDFLRGNPYFFSHDFPIPVSHYDPQMEPNFSGCFGKGKQCKPPPSFDKALKCSTPVVHVFNLEVIDEDEPPPTYEECQTKVNDDNNKAQQAKQTQTIVTIENTPCSSLQANNHNNNNNSNTRTIITTEV